MEAPIELLSTAERSLRPRIATLISRIDKQLSEVVHSQYWRNKHVLPMVQCYNLCALAAALAGQPDLARRLCTTHIGWLEKCSLKSKDIGIIAYAFQPWINLSRLDRFSTPLHA